MANNKIYHSRVIYGKKTGRNLGYPTVNLDNKNLLRKLKEGVYGCTVYIGNKSFLGLLYKGPRLILKDKEISLEIYILNFEGNLYDQTVKFKILDYIREVIDFPNVSSFRTQIEKDIRHVHKFDKMIVTPT